MMVAWEDWSKWRWEAKQAESKYIVEEKLTGLGDWLNVMSEGCKLSRMAPKFLA